MDVMSVLFKKKYWKRSPEAFFRRHFEEEHSFAAFLLDYRLFASACVFAVIFLCMLFSFGRKGFM